MKKFLVILSIFIFANINSFAQYNNLAAFAGEYELNGQKEFIVVNLIKNGESAKSVDFPNQGYFGEKIKDFKFDNGKLVFKMKLGRGYASFSGKPTSTNYTGTVTSGKSKGKFTLFPIVKSSMVKYDEIAGYYRFPDKRELLFTFESYEKSYLFYLENDRVIRLYPVNTHTFISSKGELFNFPKDYEYNRVVNSMIGGDRAQGIYFQKYIEKEFTVNSDGTKLKGSLILPSAHVKNTKYPLLVFSNPTHPGDRNLLRLYAHYFLNKGFACYLPDRRGFGKSEGQKIVNTIVLREDLVSIVAELKKSTVIDSKKVGFVAIENGAYPALLAAEIVKPNLMIMISASMKNQIETEKYNRGIVLRKGLKKKKLIKNIEFAWELYYDQAVNDENSKFDYTKYKRLIDKIYYAKESIPDNLKWEIPPRLKEDELSKVRGLGSYMAMNPKISIAKINKPFFFFIPGNDPVSDQMETINILKSKDMKKYDISKYSCPTCTNMLVSNERIMGHLQTMENYKKLSDWKISTEFFSNVTNWAKKK
jgi:alpha/beta superfamily hydrolase